jgi:uncharacterized protein YjbI with pentapeptide repeats
LGLKLPIFWFYALAPLIVLALHAELLRIRPAPTDVWAPALRFVGNFLAPLALFLLLWNFAPYAHARPAELPGLSAGMALTYFLAAALLLDAALLLYPYLDPPNGDGRTQRGSWQSLGRIGVALLALQQAGLIWLVALGLATLAEIVVERTELAFVRPVGVPGTTLTIFVAALIGAVAWTALVLIRRILKEAAPMPIYAILVAVFLIGIVLPDFGRPLNLVRARLVAAEPSEAVLAAMIVASAKPGGEVSPQPAAARRQAWKEFGRGLDYARWHFASAAFDDAVMPLIHLDQADLTDASLIRADLTDASLVGTILRRTRLDEADLRGANLTCVNNEPCLVQAQAPATQPPTPGAQPPGPRAQQSTIPGAVSTRPGREVCQKGASGGRTLNNAQFVETIIEHADLSNASLKGVNLADLKKVKNLDGVPETSIKQTNLSGADLTGANLRGVTFRTVDLTNACLCGADLTDADLRSATLKDAVLRSAQLKGAKLPAELEGIDFENAHIQETMFAEKTNLNRANLTGVDQEPSKPSCRPGSAGAP